MSQQFIMLIEVVYIPFQYFHHIWKVFHLVYFNSLLSDLLLSISVPDFIFCILFQWVRCLALKTSLGLNTSQAGVNTKVPEA